MTRNAAQAVPIVIDGHPAAVIVTPESPCPAVTFAAQEFQHHVCKATDVQLAIVTENAVPSEPAGRVYIGAVRAALDAGIDTNLLERDAYRILTRPNEVFLAGHDGDGDPLHKSFDTPVGSLFAVYEVLDEDFGVRWLWPGELGEHVPSAKTLRIMHRDKVVSPRFRFSKLRTDRRDELIWMRRMRMHNTDGMVFGHAFGDWEKMYGQSHPEYFEMDSEGVRHPNRSMCVSNPGLRRQIVENWWAEQQSHPPMRTTVNACENDFNGACCCPDCLSWDGQEAPHPRPHYYETSHNVSERYARYLSAVLELARQYDPEAEVTHYAYLNYVFGPRAMKLDPHIIVGYVADVFFPRTREDHEWVKLQWELWAEAGVQLFMRPNYLLNGYCVPANWVRQFADEFRFCEEHGLIGSEFDSLNGQWGTQGPILYAIGRLHAAPSLSIDEILEEYYSGFGLAAQAVKNYWDYWERYTYDHIELLQNGTDHWFSYPKDAYIRFPLSSFSPADKLMVEAERAADGNEKASARVDFLREALDHARKCVETSIAIAEACEDTDAAERAVEELRAFRKTLKYPFAVNVDYRFYSCEAREQRAGWPQ